MTQERRNELLEIKARWQNMLEMFDPSDFIYEFLLSLIAGVEEELL